MNTQPIYSNLIKKMYDLPLEDKLEIRNLLDHNIAESKREAILKNFKLAQLEEKDLKFSSKISELKKSL